MKSNTITLLILTALLSGLSNAASLATLARDSQFLASNGQNYKCEQGKCMYCQQRGSQIPTCQACHGFRIVNGSCSRIPMLVSNCEAFGDLGTCVLCKEGFYVTSKRQCKSISQKEFPHCYNLGTAGQRCIGCEENYYLSGEVCLHVDTEVFNCRFYRVSGRCIGCITGFVFQNGKCIERVGDDGCSI